ncbi:MAG: hypothetical protein ABI190_03150 [Casimicrobiaceae bacterium]
MQIVLVAPQLLSLPAALLRGSASLARLCAWSDHSRCPASREEALLAELGMGDVGAGSLLARVQALPAEPGHWLVADPVTLVPGRDDVCVVARVEDLDAAFVVRAMAVLNAHFRVDGLQFNAPRPQRWLARVESPAQAAMVATEAALGGSAYVHRPQGSDARRFERYANEIQMLLHDAPENDMRERAGRAPFNGLWLWGSAAATPAATTVVPPVRIDAYGPNNDGGDLARGAALYTGGHAKALGAHLDMADHGAPRAVFTLPAATPATFAMYDMAWFAPALSALARGTISHLTLIADGAGTHRWSAAAPAFLARLRTSFRSRPFGVPE